MYETIKVTLRGTRPLIMHNVRLADPLDPIVQEISKITRKQKKTDQDRIALQLLEWEGGLYTSGDKIVLPGLNVEGCLKQAGGMNRQKKQVEAGVMVEDDSPLIYDGPKDINKLKADARFRDTRGAKIQGKVVMRTRPIFKAWSLPVVISYLPEVINESMVRDLLAFAGMRCGIGDYKPKHGRFTVE